jgi:methyl-accepting chemotaxis protein
VIIDGLIPKMSELDDETLRRRRLFVITSFVVSFFGVFFAEEIWRTGGEGAAIVMLLGGAALGLANATLFPRTVLQPLGPYILVAIMVAVMWALPVVSGAWFWDASVWWQVPIPLVAGFLLGGRAASLTAALIAMGMVGMSLLTPANYVPADDALFFRSLAAVTVVITVLLLTGAYEAARRAALRRVDEALADLKAANAKLEAMAQKTEGARAAAAGESERRGSFIQTMRSTIEEQGSALDQTSSAMAEITTTLHAVAEAVGSVASESERSNQSAADVRGKTERMADQINTLVSAITDTAAALEEIGASVREVSLNVEGLNQVAERTATAMTQMHVSIEEVSRNAAQTKDLAGHVIGSASEGAEAVMNTRDGIAQMVQVSQIGTHSIRALAERVAAISQLLDVIREVADQTQLLSLNAAIMAEQAGDRGRGFGVVAAEIKKLAARTSGSAKDIGAVILRIQKEAKRAVITIGASENAATEGLARSEKAAEKLKIIVESAGQTTAMINAIASATGEQRATAGEVAGAMDRLVGSAAQIAGATIEQATTAERLISTTAKMHHLARELEKSGQEQREDAQSIEASASQIHRMIQQVQNAQEDQSRGSDQVLAAIERIAAQQNAQVESLANLEVQGMGTGSTS